MTVYLVRHGSAGHRNDLDPNDGVRRLDASGCAQADRLSSLLADAAIRRVTSSPYVRCVETVEPLASRFGLEVHRDDRLAEGADPEGAWLPLEKVAAKRGDSVLCSHGDLIPDLVRRARGRGMEVTGKAGSAKGSCWALEWDGERFTVGTYTPIKV